MLHWCLEAPPETERVWGGLCIGVLEPAAKRYPSLSIKTIGLIPNELYDDDFCDELKSVVENFIHQKLEDEDE